MRLFQGWGWLTKAPALILCDYTGSSDDQYDWKQSDHNHDVWIFADVAPRDCNWMVVRVRLLHSLS